MPLFHLHGGAQSGDAIQWSGRRDTARDKRPEVAGSGNGGVISKGPVRPSPTSVPSPTRKFPPVHMGPKRAPSLYDSLLAVTVRSWVDVA